jgi:hypothetical protein
MTTQDDTAVNSDATQTQQDDKATNTDAVAADKAAKSDPKTIVADKVDDTPPSKDDKPADDWRVRLAGGDEKELKRLSRFASEADVYKAYRELEKKKSSGELKQALGKDATPEEIAAWRKENGIPESPDKYDLTFDDGLVIGENDKPLVDRFVESMHGENATPSQVKAALKSYYAILADQQQALAESDVAFKDESLESLREEWGGDYKKNLNAVGGFLAALPDETREAFATARTQDGKLIGNDPAIIKWLAGIAYEINPAATVMPSSVNNPGSAISDEIASIEKVMSENREAYFKDTKMQNRYVELISAREKINARS